VHWSPRRLVVAGVAAAGLALAAPATAAPPPNDAYLASWDMQGVHGRLARTFHPAPVDTREATTQGDLFDPDQNGLPFGGGPPEPTSCGGATLTHTVWFDAHPETPGVFDLTASGYELAIALYEYDEETARISKLVGCFNAATGPVERMLFDRVRRNRDYTLQVGAVGGAGGLLDFDFKFFADRDADGVFDELDHCRTRRGTTDGCPPRIVASPRLRAAGTSTGIRVVDLRVPDVPAGGRVEVRCTGCGIARVRRAAPRGGGTVRVPQLARRALRAGALLDVLVTRPAGGRGEFRFGAYGRHVRFKIRRGDVAPRVERCLAPGSRTPRRTCPR
jgi:hypothetical protein